MTKHNSDDEIQVSYDSGDLRALYRACHRCRRNGLLLLVVMPVFFEVLSFKDGVRGFDLLIYAIPYFMIALVALLTFYFASPWYSVFLRRRNGWDKPMTVQLTDEGISTHHPNQESLFYWSKIRDVVVRGPRLFLFTTPLCAIILPRRSFESDDQFGAWAERAKGLWNSAKSVTVE